MTSRLSSILLLLSLLAGGCGAPDRPTVSLYLAVQRGDIDQVERHLHWGSDINQPFPSGRMPLHDAAEKGRIVLVKLLLKHGATVDATDSAGRTPLQLAILTGRTQVAAELLRAGAQLDASALMLDAARAGVEDRDVVRFLGKHGANLNATDEHGNSALLIAIAKGNHRLVHHLVEQGADVNLRNHEGRTALDIATRNNAVDMQQFLLRNGAVLGQ